MTAFEIASFWAREPVRVEAGAGDRVAAVVTKAVHALAGDVSGLELLTLPGRRVVPHDWSLARAGAVSNGEFLLLPPTGEERAAPADGPAGGTVVVRVHMFFVQPEYSPPVTLELARRTPVEDVVARALRAAPPETWSLEDSATGAAPELEQTVGDVLADDPGFGPRLRLEVAGGIAG